MRVRLESVDNAFEQAKAAARNMSDRQAPYDRVPWFWSDQYDNKLLIVGLSQGHDQRVIRGDPASGSFSVCYFKSGELIALEAVNHSKDYMAARKLIDARARLDPEKAGNVSVELKTRSDHSNTISRSFASICCPGRARISLIVPSRSARTVVSIFIASSVSSTSPRRHGLADVRGHGARSCPASARRHVSHARPRPCAAAAACATWLRSAHADRAAAGR